MPLSKVKKTDPKKENDVDPLKNIDEHPLAIGHFLIVKYRDDSERLATIIERLSYTPQQQSNTSAETETTTTTTAAWQYYIHYLDFNRRMDEWVKPSRIITYPSEANILEEQRRKNEECVTDLAVLGLDFDGKRHIKKRKVIDNNLNSNGDGPTTIDELEHDEHEGLDEASLKEHEEITKIKNVQNVLFGKHYMECWYFSPFPKELFVNGPLECLYFCEFSFRFFVSKDDLVRYQNKPNLPRHPPGIEIYRDEHVSMFEVDGGVEKIYCQNLSYFAKLFLDHKTLFSDVDAFLFYILCTQDDRGYHPVGYFSKEKYSDAGYNLACILTFPSSQRMGYGRFLISFSYELTKKEEKVGAPEKPLSDLGAVSYKSYWASVILVVLRSFPGSQLSIIDIAKMTSLTADDTEATLKTLGLLQVLKNGTPVICAPLDLVEGLMVKYPVKGLQVDPERIHWAPLYVMDYKKDKWSIRGKKDSSED
jgi:histone acetyltransferase MYST1